MLQRFYDPKHGSISIDGEDLRNLNVGWLRLVFKALIFSRWFLLRKKLLVNGNSKKVFWVILTQDLSIVYCTRVKVLLLNQKSSLCLYLLGFVFYPRFRKGQAFRLIYNLFYIFHCNFLPRQKDNFCFSYVLDERIVSLFVDLARWLLVKEALLFFWSHSG